MISTAQITQAVTPRLRVSTTCVHSESKHDARAIVCVTCTVKRNVALNVVAIHFGVMRKVRNSSVH